MTKACSLIFLLLFLTACAGSTLPAATNTIAPVSPTYTSTSTLPLANTVVPVLALNPTATADTRLPPERWREWPVVPLVTPRAIEIYKTGLTKGLDPHAFSKVGDCQSVKAAFMGYLDDPTRYSPSDYADLLKTIENFKGHFNTDGQAVRGGFNAAAELSPLWADPHVCLPGENPLECELRITRPIIVIVRMEIWWNGRTAAQYEKLMRQILDTIIAHGAVPILATKADNVEGDNSLNLTTAKLAYEYDLPLWNFWAAVQSLPAHGLETKPPHNDGFHISTAAWTVQSFSGLQALDSVWRGLLAAVQTSQVATPTVSQPTISSGAFSTAVQTPSLTAPPTAGPTPQGGSNRIVFGLAARQDAGYQYQGVYLLDLGSRQTHQIFGSGVQFQAASPDGKYILLSQGASLYRTNVDGASPVQMTDSLYAFGETVATWLPNGQVAAILAKPGGGTVISVLSPEGLLLGTLPVSGGSPIDLYPALDSGHIYWESGICTSPGVCTHNGAWVTSLDGTLNRTLTGITGPVVAPDGNFLAYTYLISNTESDLGLASSDGSNTHHVQIPGKMLTNYAWSPSGDMLAVVLAEVSDYSGRSSGNRNFVIDPRSQSIVEYPNSSLMHPRLLWAPDGKFMFWIGTLPTDSGFMIGGDLVDNTSRHVADLGTAIGQSGADYLLVTNAAWLPMP